MKRKISFAAIVLWQSLITFSQSNTGNSPVDWVNPLIGSQSTHALSAGNTYPAIGMPWGMHLWTPQTGKMGDGCLYL